jgi:hypothetical protein
VLHVSTLLGQPQATHFIGRNFCCTASPLPDGLISTRHISLRVCGLSMLLEVSHSFYCVCVLCWFALTSDFRSIAMLIISIIGNLNMVLQTWIDHSGVIFMQSSSQSIHWPQWRMVWGETYINHSGVWCGERHINHSGVWCGDRHTLTTVAYGVGRDIH